MQVALRSLFNVAAVSSLEIAAIYSHLSFPLYEFTHALKSSGEALWYVFCLSFVSLRGSQKGSEAIAFLVVAPLSFLLSVEGPFVSPRCH